MSQPLVQPTRFGCGRPIRSGEGNQALWVWLSSRDPVGLVGPGRATEAKTNSLNRCLNKYSQLTTEKHGYKNIGYPSGASGGEFGVSFAYCLQKILKNIAPILENTRVFKKEATVA